MRRTRRRPSIAWAVDHAGHTLAEAAVSLMLISLFVLAAFRCFSAARDTAARITSRAFGVDSLRLAADAMTHDLFCAGSGLVSDDSGFAPLVTGPPLPGGPWTDSATVYANNAGQVVVLAAPVLRGDRQLRAISASVEDGDRVLLRASGAWEAARVDDVRRHGPETHITLQSPCAHDYTSAAGVTIVQYSYDRRSRRLYRSVNGGTRQPLLEECTGLRLCVITRQDGRPVFGPVDFDSLLRADCNYDLSVAGKTVSRRVPFLVGHLESGFFGRSL
ncbi:MAG: hypothetical protein AB1714_24120 [Acidobacteriota bacterium]